MTDLRIREIGQTAELVRQRPWMHPELALLRAAGVQVMSGDGPTAVWRRSARECLGPDAGRAITR